MSLPLIGITTKNANALSLDIPCVLSPRTYSEAIIKAGAIPVLIPVNLPKELMDEIVNRVDGILFSGGGDIEIDRYGGDEHERVYGVDRERDKNEFYLMGKAISEKIPFLGICRGFQVFNVYMGGNLFTHLSDQKEDVIDHSYNEERPFDYKTHSVELITGSLLKDIIGKDEIEVNSLHHQGIKFVSGDLIVSAVTPDYLVEGLELRGHPFGLAVQWHPEWMQDDEDQQKLFSAFVSASKKRMESDVR